MSLYISPNIIEYTTPRVNQNVNYELCVIMMCLCRFINGNKCTTLVGDVDNGGHHACSESRELFRIMGNLSSLPSILLWTFNCSLKKKSWKNLYHLFGPRVLQNNGIFIFIYKVLNNGILIKKTLFFSILFGFPLKKELPASQRSLNLMMLTLPQICISHQIYKNGISM